METLDEALARDIIAVADGRRVVERSAMILTQRRQKDLLRRTSYFAV